MMCQQQLPAFRKYVCIGYLSGVEGMYTRFDSCCTITYFNECKELPKTE